MPSDCSIKAWTQRVGPDHAYPMGLATGNWLMHSLAKLKRWKSTPWFTTPTSANGQHLGVFGQDHFLREEKKVSLILCTYSWIFISCPRSVQLCGSSRTNGVKNCLSWRVSTPWSPRLDPLLRREQSLDVPGKATTEWLLLSCWITWMPCSHDYETHNW